MARTTDSALGTKQAAILVGGRGTRLGALTDSTPKPMLDVAGRPALDYIVRDLLRHGIRRILLLAGYRAASLEQYAARLSQEGAEAVVVTEAEPAGTAGALLGARDRLDGEFLLLNGDSVFALNYLDLALPPPGGWEGILALKEVAEAGRYGSVTCAGGRITGFHEKRAGTGPGLINGGVYWLARSVLDRIAALPCSIERDIFPSLAREGLLWGRRYDGFFLDIGVPEDFALAQSALPRLESRPAVFLDRDGVLNEDKNYVHRPDEIEWVQGAPAAVKRANDAGYYVFVVTNQSGVARGLYSAETVEALHGWMQQELGRSGAHIDDFRYCPHHEEGTIERYRRACVCRKPQPGMILDLAEHWPIDMGRSFLIGDKPTDIEAARGAGIPGHLFPGGRLDAFLEPLLAAAAAVPRDRRPAGGGAG